jgi:hypothetical protein
MDEVGIAPMDRSGLACDMLTRFSLIPPINEREVEACVDLALCADPKGLLGELAPDEANWLRLAWSALMDENGDAPRIRPSGSRRLTTALNRGQSILVGLTPHSN